MGVIKPFVVCNIKLLFSDFPNRTTIKSLLKLSSQSLKPSQKEVCFHSTYNYNREALENKNIP